MGVAIRKFGWARSDLVISTKLFWGGKGRNERGLSRKHIIEGTDASLKRLQLDYVDLLYAHRPDPDTPMEEIVRAFNHVINQGKAFYWGTSEWSAQQITEAHAVAGRLNLIAPLVSLFLLLLFYVDTRQPAIRLCSFGAQDNGNQKSEIQIINRSFPFLFPSLWEYYI